MKKNEPENNYNLIALVGIISIGVCIILFLVCKANCKKFITEALPDNGNMTSVNDGWNHFTPHLNLKKENFPGFEPSKSKKKKCQTPELDVIEEIGESRHEFLMSSSRNIH